MCIGIPMQVVCAEPGWAQVQDGPEQRRISTQLVGSCQAGEWLLVFLNDARERISPQRAAEVKATLHLLATTFEPTPDDAVPALAAFELPSAMSAADLQRLTQS